MKIQNPTTRYKIEFVLDTHLSKKQILDLLVWLEASMILVETEDERRVRLEKTKAIK
jgi:hypothetical protein